MNIKFILCLIFCGACALEAAVVKEEDTRTLSEAGRFDYSWFNGNFWNSRMETNQQKTYFILGLGEGIMLEQKQLYSKIEGPEVKNILENETLKLIGSKYSLTDIIKQIDDFYKIKSNLKVPVVEAYVKVLEGLKEQEKKKRKEIVE